MVFLRTLVCLFHLLFLTAAAGYAWVVGYVFVWKVLGWLGLESGEWLVFMVYAAASVALALFLTRRGKLS